MKMMKLLVAMLVVAGLVVPAIAVAEDRLSLSGEMRVRGWHEDIDVDGVDTDRTLTWADQRLRVGGKIAVAEGVSITFRTDITETNWGDGGSEYGSGRSGSTQQWDRAHLDVTKGIYHLRAGQQYVGFGEVTAVDSQDAGLLMDFKTGVPVTVFGLLDDDNDPAGPGIEADSFLYGASVKPTLTNNIASEFFVAGQTKALTDTEEAYVLGAALAFVFDPIKIVTELDYFTGDFADNIDAVGTQFYLNASFAATPAVTVGGELFYALGTDDADEVQYVQLGNGFGGWDPIFDVGTNLDNEQISFGVPFDFTGASAGVMGARLYASTKLSDALGLAASVAYLENEEDNFFDADATAFAAGLTYALMANTSLQAQIQYTDLSIDADGVVDDVDADAFQSGVGIFVNF